MRAKRGDEFAFDAGRPREQRRIRTSAVFHGITDPFALDWMFRVFDDPDDLAEIDHSQIEETWDAVGDCIREVLRSSADSNVSLAPVEKGDKVVQR